MTQTLDYSTPAAKKRSTIPWQTISQKLAPFIGMIFVFLLFSALRPQTFFTIGNLQLMLMQTAVVGTGALGITMIIISAGIDLSVGSVVALSTIVVALLVNAGVPQWIAAVGGVVVGVASGFVTGNLIIGQIGRVTAVIAAFGTGWLLTSFNQPLWLIAAATVVVLLGLMTVNELYLKKLEFNNHLGLVPFIATLVMMRALRGAAHLLGSDSTVDVPGKLWLKHLLVILNPRQPLYLLNWNVSKSVPTINQAWMLFPAGVWMLLVLSVVVAFVLNYTRFGRHIFAIGSNENTARLCGINVERTKLLIYMVGVGFAGLAGVLQFSFLGGGDSTTAPGMELDIIAATVIGGASLNGGEGSIMGSLIGALIMTMVSTGCTKMGIPTSWQEIISAGIILVAVLLDRIRHRKTG